jgi:hypothetical protein
MNHNTELPEPKIVKPKITKDLNAKTKKNTKKFKYLDDIIDKDFQNKYFTLLNIK